MAPVSAFPVTWKEAIVDIFAAEIRSHCSLDLFHVPWKNGKVTKSGASGQSCNRLRRTPIKLGGNLSQREALIKANKRNRTSNVALQPNSCKPGADSLRLFCMCTILWVDIYHPSSMWKSGVGYLDMAYGLSIE